MNSILVFGENGQVASALRKIRPQFTFIGKDKCDFNNLEFIEDILNLHRPTLIVNTSAYTSVESAEKDRELCHKINAMAPGRIAKWCFQNDSIFLHLSTDFVFDGKKEEPYVESDVCSPINYYGQSKREGELQIIDSNCRGYIFRTSWVFSGYRTNFVKTVLKAALEKEEIKMISDQFGAPTYAHDLADSLISIAEGLLRMKNGKLGLKSPGIYHMVNEGFVSRFDFAKEIVELAKEHGHTIRMQTMAPIDSQLGQNSLLRPKNSQLNCKKLKDTFGIALPHWNTGLRQVLKDLYENSRV